MTPAPGRRHQRVVVRLAAALLAWTDEHAGEVLTAPFAEPGRVLVHLLRGDRYGLPRIVAQGELLRSEQLPGFALDLARLLAAPPIPGRAS